MTRPVLHLLTLTALSIFAVSISASDKPSGAEIKAALERGKAVRDVKELEPGALGRNAFVIKINGIRCGHGLTTLEDAKGEKGAVYKLTEDARSAQADEDTAHIFDYKGSYFLNSRLGLISASLRWKETTRNMKNDKQETQDEFCDLSVEKDELHWNANIGGAVSKDHVALNGETPIPQSILCALAAFAQRSDLFGKAICVPELAPRADKDGFDIQAAWIVFDKAKDKRSAAYARMLHLMGLPERKELEGLPGTVWSGAQVLGLDGAQITSYPDAAPGVDVEPIAAEKLEPDAPLDLAKIAAAVNDMAQPKK